MMLSYLQSLTLLTARRAIGHSLAERSTPQEPFSTKDRSARGIGAGDRVDAAVEARVVLSGLPCFESFLLRSDICIIGYGLHIPCGGTRKRALIRYPQPEAT